MEHWLEQYDSIHNLEPATFMPTLITFYIRNPLLEGDRLLFSCLFIFSLGKTFKRPLVANSKSITDDVLAASIFSREPV